jgi:hypothetical protein
MLQRWIDQAERIAQARRLYKLLMREPVRPEPDDVDPEPKPDKLAEPDAHPFEIDEI